MDKKVGVLATPFRGDETKSLCSIEPFDAPPVSRRRRLVHGNFYFYLSDSAFALSSMYSRALTLLQFTICMIPTRDTENASQQFRVKRFPSAFFWSERLLPIFFRNRFLMDGCGQRRAFAPHSVTRSLATHLCVKV